MAAKDKKPQLEIPEEELLDHFVDDDQDDEDLVLPQTKPESVSEGDWVDQQTDVPIDEDEDDYKG